MLRTTLLSALAAVAALAAFAGAARAETVHLKNGRTLVGDARLEGDDVVVDVRFPTEQVVRLKRADLTPESLFEVLDRRTPSDDVAKRRALGETAESLGLPGAAIAEYRRVRALDPASAAEMDKRIGRLEDVVAADLLDDAKDLLAEGMANASLVRLHAILETYPGTEAAKAAKALLSDAEKAAGASAEVSARTVVPAEVARWADLIEEDLRKGDAAATAAGREGAGGSANLRALLRAVERFEDAWREAKRLPVTVAADAALEDRVGKLRVRAKASLVRAYLDASSVYLQRRSIASAERFSDKACELDPRNADVRSLQGVILLAKACTLSCRCAVVR